MKEMLAAILREVADGAVLTSHWAVTPYAQVWNDPGFAPVRRAWERICAGWQTEYGVDVPALDAILFLHPRKDVLLAPGLTAGQYLDERLREIGLKK